MMLPYHDQQTFIEACEKHPVANDAIRLLRVSLTDDQIYAIHIGAPHQANQPDHSVTYTIKELKEVAAAFIALEQNR